MVDYQSFHYFDGGLGGVNVELTCGGPVPAVDVERLVQRQKHWTILVRVSFISYWIEGSTALPILMNFLLVAISSQSHSQPEGSGFVKYLISTVIQLPRR